MSAVCPEGHLSDTDDWCDICGSPIAPDRPIAAPIGAGTGPEVAAAEPAGLLGRRVGAAPAELSPTAPQALPPSAPPPSAPSCPVCAEPRSGSRYCEACAYDFETGAAPAAALPVAIPAHAPAPAGPAVGWVAEVCPDREFFDRNDDDIAFPDLVTRRAITLVGDRSVIGRRSPRRNIFPEIDLALAPEDRGVSRVHAFLDHTDDGRLAVTDAGSANGTWIGDDPTPIPPGRTVTLADGDSFHVGSFTRITVRRT